MKRSPVSNTGRRLPYVKPMRLPSRPPMAYAFCWKVHIRYGGIAPDRKSPSQTGDPVSMGVSCFRLRPFRSTLVNSTRGAITLQAPACRVHGAVIVVRDRASIVCAHANYHAVSRHGVGRRWWCYWHILVCNGPPPGDAPRTIAQLRASYVGVRANYHAVSRLGDGRAKSVSFKVGN